MFYGWWIVAVSLMAHALGEGLFSHSFGAYFVRFQAEFQWSRTLLSGAYSLSQLTNGALGPARGWLIDRAGPRAMLRAGFILMSVGFILLSRVNSGVMFYLVFLLISVGASMAGGHTLHTTIAHWFIKKRMKAIGLAATGNAVGGLMVPGVAWALNHLGWRSTAFYSGVALLVLGLLLAQFMRRSPEQYGQLPDGVSPESPEGKEGEHRQSLPQPEVSGSLAQEGFTAPEALRTPAFWLIGLGHASAILVVQAVIVHLIPHLVKQLHMSLERAAGVVSLLMLMQIAGVLSGAVIGDRMNKRMVAAVCMFGHMAGLLMLAFATSFAMVAGFAVLHGVAWGLRGPLMFAIRADYFGRRSLATVIGLSLVLTTLGSLGGPLVAGVLADRLGDYRIGFTILAVVTGMGSIFFLLARRPKHHHTSSRRPA